MFNEAFSHGRKFTFDSSNLDYINLNKYVEDQFDNEFTVRSVFIVEKAKHGPRPVVVSDKFNIYVPNHMVDDIRKILSTPEMCDAINAGKCGCKVYQYQDKDGVTRNGVSFYDI